jgi:hypothetical protein
MPLTAYLAQLRRAFAARDRYEAHKAAAPILHTMVENRSVLHEILKQNLAQPDFLRRKRHHPVIGFPVEENTSFSLIASCFLPLPDRATDVSHQTIHHHGDLLLTTIAAHGQGYESVLFRKGWEIDHASRLARMEVDKRYTHRLGNVEFVDAYVPHIVFFPRELSITYALWSNRRKYPLDRLRRAPFLQQFKEPLTTLAKKLGATRSLGINAIEYFDFFVEGGKVYALKERIFGYEPGSNENFVQNVCYVLQEVGFTDEAFLSDVKTRLEASREERAARWIDRLLRHEPVPDAFESAHLNIDKVNLRKADVLAAFPGH